MARVSPLSKLPDSIRDELHNRLRNNGYSDFIQLAEWLTSQGIGVGKSAVHRYSQDLKAKDRVASSITLAAKGTQAPSNEVLDLMMELSTLRIREHQVLRRLEELGKI